MPDLITFRFCHISELREKGSITKWVDELRDEITAVSHNGKIYVISSICPHFGGEFNVDANKGELRCKWHDWCFDLVGGQCKNRSVKTRLRHYDFDEQDGMVVVLAR